MRKFFDERFFIDLDDRYHSFEGSRTKKSLNNCDWFSHDKKTRIFCSCQKLLFFSFSFLETWFSQKQKKTKWWWYNNLQRNYVNINPLIFKDRCVKHILKLALLLSVIRLEKKKRENKRNVRNVSHWQRKDRWIRKIFRG